MHEVPNPTANTTPVIPPFGQAANEVAVAQVNQDPPPPPPATLPVRNVIPEWVDASKLSERFQKHHPPTFYKLIHDSMFLVTWIRDLERIFEVLPCSDLEKIRCATFQFRGDVDVWWHSSKDHFWVKYPNATWAQFKATFLENYFPRDFQEKKEIEFMNLSQGSKSVLDYQQLCEEYFYFSPTHFKTEDVKARRFERGLRTSLSTSVVLHKYSTYAEVVEAAKLIED
ncbi:uncharacterized protein LOC122659339 [Telopea speciosissima]|uniref:uncharacterized protein LOC122659339 n=1 Tax=Telopea speciosissima TaxID=54955 RepID=UPI001CC73FD1|nr:uncharacterized protein LOC122659339 [Telopea speciosissima]